MLPCVAELLDFDDAMEVVSKGRGWGSGSGFGSSTSRYTAHLIYTDAVLCCCARFLLSLFGTCFFGQCSLPFFSLLIFKLRV